MKGLLKRTVVAGSIAVVVVATVAIAVVRTVEKIGAAMVSFEAALPFDIGVPYVTAVLALVAVVLVTGLFLQVRPIRRRVDACRDRLVSLFPFLGIVRSFENRILEPGGVRSIKAALADVSEDGAFVPAFVMEELADGRCVVFVPASPNPSQGSVYVLPRERVHLVDASVRELAHIVRSWGMGAAKVLEPRRKPT